jgi:dolichol kinase
MSLNLTIENVIGAIPVVGDLAHVAWKANRRNYNLLIRDQQSLQRHTWKDWLFVIGMVLFVLVLFLGPIALIIYLLRSHWPLWSHR